jgi:Domain of unknown function (DUF4145)
MSFNWVCPYCSRPQAVASEKHNIATTHIGVTAERGITLAMRRISVACVNPDCLNITVHVAVGKSSYSNGELKIDSNKLIFDQRILPAGVSNPQPTYIPNPIVEDYYEACLIRDLSPKAAATLIRRCLQGMIRDFSGISKATLDLEIKALRSAVETGAADRSISIESVEAIDHVRGIGNIGAHMEKDIDLIVLVDAGEAQALIELVEMLFDEWYVARHTRTQRLSRIEGIASEKKAIKAQNVLAAPVLNLPAPEINPRSPASPPPAPPRSP